MRAPGLFLLLAILSACGNGDAGESSSSGSPYPSPPTQPGTEIRGENDFAGLLTRASRGKPSPSPWSGYWWPFLDGGISSTAAKYEQIVRQPGALAWERDYHGARTPGVQSWWGHCNGWAAASVLFAEPSLPVSRQDVTLSIGDQKALLSEIAQEVNADFFGLRSDTSETSSREFDDIYPNQFFLVLTNLVGKGQPLIMDRYTGDQVWNHAIAGYEIAPVRPEDDLGADPSAPGVYRVLVTTRIWWMRNDVPPDHLTEAFEFRDGPSYEGRTLRYEVWLDAPLRFSPSGELLGSGRVVLARQGDVVLGGAWRNGSMDPANSHPDYLWIPHSLAPATVFANPEIRPSVVSGLLSPP